VTADRLEVDVAVVGAGAAGAMAAIAAAEAGAKVALVAGPPGATTLSSGAVDLADAPEGPLERLPEDALARLSDRATELLSSEDGPYGQVGPRPTAVTSLGAARESWLLQRAQLDLARIPRPVIAVVDAGPARRFSASAIARSLARQEGLTAHTIDLKMPAGVDLEHPLLVARRLDDDEGLQGLLGEAIARDVDAAEEVGAVLVPPILGLDRSTEVARRLSEAAGAPVGEVLGSPGDPSGLRLARRLAALVEASGARHVRASVAGADCTEDRVEVLHVQGPEDIETVTAAAFVLATGGLSGGGLVLSERLAEPLLTLPISGLSLPVPANAHGVDPKALFGLDPAGPHQIQRAGVETDGELRPPGFSNVWCAGALLAGADPTVCGSGLGTALITGLLAGEMAARIAK